LATDAVVALQAGREEGHHDFVTDVEFLDRVSLFDDLADELVPADEIRWALEVAAVEVQVTAAERGAGDFEDGVGGLLDLGIWAVFYRDLGQFSVSVPCPFGAREERGTL
jgi:hypothetical protein